jgi:reactive intermediate/imine deaminase
MLKWTMVFLSVIAITITMVDGFERRKSMQLKSSLNPKQVATPVGQYSQVTSAHLGDRELLFISGQVAVDEQGKLVGAGNMKAQAEQAFSNLNHILEAYGASFDNVLKITVFVTDMSRRAEVAQARSRFVGASPPASTFVEVSKLADDAWLVEVEAVAIVGAKR